MRGISIRRQDENTTHDRGLVGSGGGRNHVGGDAGHGGGIRRAGRDGAASARRRDADGGTGGADRKEHRALAQGERAVPRVRGVLPEGAAEVRARRDVGEVRAVGRHAVPPQTRSRAEGGAGRRGGGHPRDGASERQHQLRAGGAAARRRRPFAPALQRPLGTEVRDAGLGGLLRMGGAPSGGAGLAPAPGRLHRPPGGPCAEARHPRDWVEPELHRVVVAAGAVHAPVQADRTQGGPRLRALRRRERRREGERSFRPGARGRDAVAWASRTRRRTR